MTAATTLVQAAAAGVAPTGQCGSAGGGGEGGAPPAGGAVRGAGARGAPAPSPPAPEPGPDIIYRLEMESGRTGSGCQAGLEGSGGEHSGQPSGGMRREGGQAEQSTAAAEGHRGQREGEQESGSQRSGHTGSAVQGRGAGQVEGGKGKHSGHGLQGKGAGQEGLQGKGHGRAGLHGVGSKGHEAAGRKGKGQGKEGGHGYMGSPVFPGKVLGWWGGVEPPAIPPVIRPFPPPPYPAMGMMYPPPSAYQGVPAQAHVQQRPQAGATTWGAQGGRGEEHRRAWERIEKAERSLREREERVMGGAGRVAEGRTEGTGRPQGGEAQAPEELQWARADLRRRQERVERAEQEGGRHEEGGGLEGRPPNQVSSRTGFTPTELFLERPGFNFEFPCASEGNPKVD